MNKGRFTNADWDHYTADEGRVTVPTQLGESPSRPETRLASTQVSAAKPSPVG